MRKMRPQSLHIRSLSVQRTKVGVELLQHLIHAPPLEHLSLTHSTQWYIIRTRELTAESTFHFTSSARAFCCSWNVCVCIKCRCAA